MNLEKHIDKAVKAYEKAYNDLDHWAREKEAAEKELHAKTDKMTREAAVEEHSKFVAKYSEKFESIREELNKAVDDAEQAFVQEVADFYRPDGNAINEADSDLLKSGILTQEELSEMIVKHGENPTMLRMIEKHVKEIYGYNLETVLKETLFKAKKAGEYEKQAFEKFRSLAYVPVNLANDGQTSTELFMKTALKVDEYAEAAKIDLLRAKMFRDDETAEKIRAYEEKMREEHNSAFLGSGIDIYN